MTTKIQTESETTAPTEEKKFSITLVLSYVYPLLVLFLMFYASALRTTHRQFLNVASKPVKRDLKISDDLFGAITGPIFSAAHATAGVIVGRLCDVYSRKIIIIIMVAVWTTFNCLHAFIQNYWHLIIVRIGLSAGMGAVPSVAFSLISDYFPVNRRAAAISIYNTSLFCGFAFTFAVGGFLDQDSSNWRDLFLILGIPGLIYFFLLIFILKEPERGKYESNIDTQKHSMTTTLLYIIKRPSMWCLCFIGGISFMMANSATVWQPTFYYRVHKLTPQDLAYWMTWISPISGIFGSLIGGVTSDFMQKRFQRGYVIVCIISIAIGSPFLIAVYFMPTGVSSILMFLPSSFFGFVFLPPMYMITVQIMPTSMRAVSVGWFFLFLGGIGSFGPLIIGLLNKANFPYFDYQTTDEAVKWSLLTLSATCQILVFILFVVLFFLLPRDLKALEDWNKVNVEEQPIVEAFNEEQVEIQ